MKTQVAIAVFAVSLHASASPAHAEFERQLPDGPCATSIKAVGPTVGHKTGTAPDGKPAIFALVRSEGVEYVVRCDAATGMINDVSRRLVPGQS